MKKLGSFLAVAVAVVAVIASTTYGRNEPRTVPQIVPLQMMADQHLMPERMTDLSLVFE